MLRRLDSGNHSRVHSLEPSDEFSDKGIGCHDSELRRNVSTIATRIVPQLTQTVHQLQPSFEFPMSNILPTQRTFSTPQPELPSGPQQKQGWDLRLHALRLCAHSFATSSLEPNYLAVHRTIQGRAHGQLQTS